MAPPLANEAVQPVNINPQEEQQLFSPVDISPSGPGPFPPSAKVSRERANKFDMGFPGIFPDTESTTAAIENGYEQVLRTWGASWVDKQKAAFRQQEIKQTVAKGTLAPDDVDYIKKLTDPNYTTSNPYSVLEEQYANEYINSLRNLGKVDPDSAWRDLDTQTEHRMLLSGRMFKTKQELMITALEKAQQADKGQSMLGYLWDKTWEMVVPFKWQADMRGSWAHLPFGLGNDLEQRSNEFFSPSMPVNEFMAKFIPEVEQRIRDNPSLAVQWITAMLGQSTDEKTLTNFFSAADLPVLGGVAKGIAGLGRSAKAAMEVRSMMGSAIKNGLIEEPSKPAMKEAAGAVGEAGVEQFTAETAAGLKGKLNPIRAAINNFPALFKSEADNLIAGAPGRYRREFVERMYEQATKTGSDFVKGIDNAIRIEGLPALHAITEETRRFAATLAEKYPELKNNVIQAGVDWDKDLGYKVDLYLGQNNTEPWTSKNAMNGFINGAGLRNLHEEVKVGNKYYSKVSQPINQFSPYVRDLVATTGVKTPDLLLPEFANRFLRTPEETLAAKQLIARKSTVYGPNAYTKVAKQTIKDYDRLRRFNSIPGLPRRQEWLDLEKILSAKQSEEANITALHELDDFWQKTLGTGVMPSERQAAAFFSWTRAESLYHKWRDFNALKYNFREGALDHTFYTKDPATETAKSIGFKGVTATAEKLNAWPKGIDDSILIIGRKLGDEQVIHSGTIRGNVKTAFEEDVKGGKATMYRIVNPGERPLKDFSVKLQGDVRPRFVVTYGTVDHNPLSLKTYGNKIPQYDYEHSVKQAIVRRDPVSGKQWYEGDRTIMVHNIGALTREVAKAMNGIQLHLRQSDETAARDFYRTTGLPHDFKDILEMFKPTQGGSGLSLTEPFHAVPRGKMTIDIDREAMKTRYMDNKGKNSILADGAHEGYQREIGEKYDTSDVFTLRQNGTQANPSFSLQPVKYLDPTTFLNRSLKRVINSSFLDDYRTFSVEHWLQEASPLFKNVSREELAASPSWYFHNADSFWQPEVGAIGDRIGRLRTSNMQIQQMFGYNDATSRYLHRVSQKLVDSIYGSGHPLAAEWMLPKLKDPIDFMRAVTFHSKVGLFAVPQLLVQMNSFVNIYAIAGLRPAMSGTAGATLYGWSKLNRHPEIWDHLDKIASNMGFKAGDWKQITERGEGSGFFTVANEHAFRDNPWMNNIVSNGVHTALDWGSMFFRGGEKSVRISAWYTAAAELAKTKPVRSFTEADWASVLQRADLFTGNMSRASTAQMQHGVFAPMLQFKTYSLRLAEQALGKRLTVPERVRLFGTYAAFYGIGVFGLTGLPIETWVRNYLIDNQYNVGEKWIKSAAVEGIPATLTALATGDWYGVQQRYGVQGPFDDLFKFDKTWLEALAGAPGQLLQDTLGNTHGLYKSIMDLLARRNDYKLNVDDLVKPLQGVSSVESWRQLLAAISHSKLIDKHANTLTEEEISKSKAIGMFFTGLKPQEIADAFAKFRIQSNVEKAQKSAKQNFREYIRKGYLAANNGDPEQQIDWWKRAIKEMEDADVPDTDIIQELSIALQDTPTTTQSAWQFAFGRHVPVSRQQSAQEQYQALQDMRNKK